MNGMRALRKQGGMSLVTAIFILVVLSAIGGYMVLTAVVQSRTTVMALQGARAYHAARSGLEWGIFSDLASDSCNTGTFDVNGFSVTVGCSQTTFTEGGQTYNVYRVTSLSQFGSYGSQGYISRQLAAKVTGAIP